MTLEKDVMDVVARGADDIVGRAAPHVSLLDLKRYSRYLLTIGA